VSLHAAGIPNYGDALLVGSAVAAFVLLVLFLRVGIEVRSSWGALLSLAISAACLGTVLGVRLGWLWADAQMFRVMARALLMMVGHAALFFALCVYGAYVYREANGLSRPANATRKSRRRRDAKRSDDDQESPRPRKQRRPESASAGQVAPASKKRVRPSREETAGNQPAKRSEPKAVKRRVDPPAGPQQGEDEDPADEEMTKLSKSERRRLRKQRRRERQQQ
jgi:hypothetical protein